MTDGKHLGLDLRALRRKLVVRRIVRRIDHLRPAPASQTAATNDEVLVSELHLRTRGCEISMMQLAQGFVAAGRRVELMVHTLRRPELAVPAGVAETSLDREGVVGA